MQPAALTARGPPAAGSYIGLIQMIGSVLYPELYVDKAHLVCTFLFGLHAYWNGGFFMSRTVDAYTRFTIKEKEAKAKAKAEKVATTTSHTLL